jgi:hypothetical protein
MAAVENKMETPPARPDSAEELDMVEHRIYVDSRQIITGVRIWFAKTTSCKISIAYRNIYNVETRCTVSDCKFVEIPCLPENSYVWVELKPVNSKDQFAGAWTEAVTKDLSGEPKRHYIDVDPTLVA